MPTRLISLDYQAPHCDTSLENLPVVIGHAADVEIRLDHPSVGKYHCQIDSVDGRLVVRDLGSLHGTFVNGSRITEAFLAPGDQLAVGMLTFVVQGGQQSKQRPQNGAQRWEKRESLALS